MSKIVHLIVIEDSNQIGMDEIVRRISSALQGNVIELRSVSPPNVTPTIAPPAPPAGNPPGEYVTIKAGHVGWARRTPDGKSSAVAMFKTNNGRLTVVGRVTGWVQVDSTFGPLWIDEQVTQIA